MAVGSVINATDYNNIRTLIDSIIGTGASGYGRTLVSAAKSPTDLIQSTDVINLFLDCQALRLAFEMAKKVSYHLIF